MKKKKNKMKRLSNILLVYENHEMKNFYGGGEASKTKEGALCILKEREYVT